jgi:hypothetical protein
MKLDKTDETTDSRFMFSALISQKETVLPTFKETNNSDWVKFGDDNMYPDELLSLFEKSGLHNAIIESKTRMMVGDGIVQDVETDDELSTVSQAFIDNANPYDSITEVYKKCAMDFEIYGLAYLEIIWGKGRKKIAEIYHLDASKVRWGKKEKGRVKTYYYSSDWSNYRKELYKPLEIPVFDNTASSARQILPIIRYTPGLNYYAYSDYVAGTKWINIDTEIANFHFNNLKNGMAPSMFFGFPVGETTNEERESIVSGINNTYNGTNNTSKPIVTFYDAEGDKKPEVKIMEMSNADKQYDLLNKTTLQQILIAHKVTNENLVGISTPGKLGSANELLQNYELYFNTVVKPEQQSVLSPFQKLMLINGMNEIKIINNKPIDMDFSENILKEILTQDEMRDIIGYDVLEEGEIVIEDDNDLIGDDDVEPEEELERESEQFAGVRSIDRNNAVARIPNANMDDKYEWRMRSAPGEKEICPACKSWNGQVKTLAEWMNNAIPGTPTGLQIGLSKTNYATSPYATFCASECRCRLVRVK